jgi:hypothetical protein
MDWRQQRMRERAIERSRERKRVRASTPLLFAGLGPGRRTLNVKGMRAMAQTKKLEITLYSESEAQESTFATKANYLIADCKRAGLNISVNRNDAEEEPNQYTSAPLDKPTDNQAANKIPEAT